MNQTLVVFLILFTISISSILFFFVAFSPNSTGSSLVSYYPALSVTPATAERLGAIYYDGSYLKCYENGVWKNCISGESGGPGSPTNPLIVVKTADEVVYNSTTLQNDDHLFFDVGANEVWFVEWHIRLLSGTTPGWKWAVTAPSGTTCYSYNWGQIGALTAAGTIAGTACGTAISVDGTEASALFVGFSRIITGSTAGRVQLQWAQNTANASNTIVYANSYLIAHKIK